MFCISFDGFFSKPISTIVPTIARTMFRKKRFADIVKIIISSFFCQVAFVILQILLFTPEFVREKQEFLQVLCCLLSDEEKYVPRVKEYLHRVFF